MADSLVLTGVKDIKKHTGTPKEMLLTRPKRGGDTHAIREWWKDRGAAQYVNCTVFDVTVGGNTVKLAIASNMSTNLRIDHDGSFNFAFYGINEVARAALFTQDLEVIEHYVFPRISGGKVMTVTPAGAASKPGVVPPTPTGPATSVTLVGTVSTEADGTYTGVATTSANGAGLTVSYEVATNVASNLAIVAAGDDYEDGDSFTVDGDTGVTGTVSI